MTVGTSVSRPCFFVEMNLELGFVLASFGVHFVLEVGQEFFERVNRSAESDVSDD